jgi:hypothetical protein
LRAVPVWATRSLLIEDPELTCRRPALLMPVGPPQRDRPRMRLPILVALPAGSSSNPDQHAQAGQCVIGEVELAQGVGRVGRPVIMP